MGLLLSTEERLCWSTLVRETVEVSAWRAAVAVGLCVQFAIAAVCRGTTMSTLRDQETTAGIRALSLVGLLKLQGVD